MGSVTDRIKNESFGESILYGLHPLPKVLSCLGGLGDHDNFFHTRQMNHLLRTADSVGSAMSIPHQAHDLRMILIAHDNGMISLLGMRVDYTLHPGHTGAGG